MVRAEKLLATRSEPQSPARKLHSTANFHTVNKLFAPQFSSTRRKILFYDKLNV